MRKQWLRDVFARRFFVALLIIVQVVTILILVLNGSRNSRFMGYALNIVSFFVALHILSNNNTKGGYKMTWIFLILTFPVFGGLFYLLIKCQSSTRKFRKRFEEIENKSSKFMYLPGNSYAEAKEFEKSHIRQIRYLQKSAGFPIYANTQTKYLTPGEKMFECLVEELEKAEKYIFFEYFIIEEGKMWNTILEILERKARQGVDVRIIYDDMGCFFLLPKNYAQILREKGIKCAIFNPFRPVVEVMQNNRDHRKITVIDGKVAFTGGINLADEYINKIEKHGHWKDSSVMLTGDGAWSFTMMFLRMWSYCTGKDEDYRAYYPSGMQKVPGDGYVQPYSDTPTDDENIAEQVYLNIINNAKNYLYITTPYLIIDDNMITQLILAAKSGVDVRIITPEVWDKRFVHITTRSYYHDLIEAGIKVYEYKGGFMHAKTFVCDDSVATVGTINLDYRSLYLHFECGVCMYNTSAVGEVKHDFIETLEKCHEMSSEECEIGTLKRILGKIMRLFAPLM